MVRQRYAGRNQTSAASERAEDARAIDAYYLSWPMPYGQPCAGQPITAVPLDILRQIRSRTRNLNLLRRCAEEIDRRHRIRLINPK